MHPLLNIALKAARRAGNVIVRALDNLNALKVNEKSKHDYVTEIDVRAEPSQPKLSASAESPPDPDFADPRMPERM